MKQLSSNIGDTLFTKTQQGVLGLLYGQPQSSFYLNEIVRIVNMGKGTVNRELGKLCRAGLISVQRQGNQSHYQANADNPIYDELKSIVIKTFGLAEVIRASLQPLMESLELAFIYGSIAKGEEDAASDIDLMLVGGDVSYGEVMVLLEGAEERLSRLINPTILSLSEFKQRLDTEQSFLTRVMEQSKIWITGKEGYEH